MFKKDEYVVFGINGLCKVLEVTKNDMDGVEQDELFYVLEPKCANGNKIYTHVDNDKVIMRSVLNKTEAAKLISEVSSLDMLEITNEKLLQEQYKQTLRTCDCREWMRLIKTTYLRSQRRIAEGKKVTSTDEKYLKSAKDCLLTELSMALDQPKSEIESDLELKLQPTRAI